MINIYGQSEQPTVTSDAKSPWQHQQAHEAASKGYDDYMQAKKYEEGLHNLNGILTFTDYATLATGLGSLLSKGASMAGKQVGKQMAKRAVGKEFKRQSKHLATPNNMLPNNVGWGPRQSIHVVHDKNSAGFPKLYFPERWDAIHEGAPEVGIWYQGKLGNPRTAANHSIPGKAEKAAKARERFAKRPYRVEGDLELERPIVTVGDVPNRAALERAADKMNADGVIFNNVYDNGYSNNQVIFSLRDDLKNGRLYNKSKELPPILSNSKSGVASPRTSLAFYIRPSKLTKAEKVGIPKGERLEVLPYYSAMSKAQYELFKNLPNNGYNRMVWGYLNRNHAIRHSRKYGPNAVVVKFTHAKDAKMAPEIDANGNIWFGIPNKDNKAKLTDHVVLDNINSGYDVTTINNVNEVGVPSDIIAVHPYVPVKGERIKFKRK